MMSGIEKTFLSFPKGFPTASPSPTLFPRRSIQLHGGASAAETATAASAAATTIGATATDDSFHRITLIRLSQLTFRRLVARD